MSIEYLTNLIFETRKAGRPVEGSADDDELACLANLASKPRIKIIAEIGFNAGRSSHAFLAANQDAMVYSFDLGEFDYVSRAKAHIDRIFPGRHTLILGNSLRTVPEFYKANPELKFDLIFVDGGHEYEVAMADLLNMRKLAKSDTTLIMDDLTPWTPWGLGPTLAWAELIAQKLAVQDELWKDGKRGATIQPPGKRVWAVGRYTVPS